MNNTEISNPKTEVEKGLTLNDKDYIESILTVCKDLEKNLVVAMTEASHEAYYEKIHEMFEDIAEGISGAKMGGFAACAEHLARSVNRFPVTFSIASRRDSAFSRTLNNVRKKGFSAVTKITFLQNFAVEPPNAPATAGLILPHSSKISCHCGSGSRSEDFSVRISTSGSGSGIFALCGRVSSASCGVIATAAGRFSSCWIRSCNACISAELTVPVPPA